MIHLVFEDRNSGGREETHPAQAFHIDHGCIRREPDSQVVAQLLPDKMWKTADKAHIRIECIGKSKICFENEEKDLCLGPFERVKIVAGAIYDGDRVIGLFLEKSSRWLYLLDNTEWPAVLVKAA